MEEFVEQLYAMGYKNILPLKVNGYRKERVYFSAESQEGDRVFIKWLINGSSIEKKEISHEKKIGRILGGKEYPLPQKYNEYSVVSEFVDSVGDIKWAIKKEEPDEALGYIRASIENYIELLECLNHGVVECYNYGYLSVSDIFIWLSLDMLDCPQVALYTVLIKRKGNPRAHLPQRPVLWDYGIKTMYIVTEYYRSGQHIFI